MEFNLNDKVGQIVAKFPGASDVFYNYNIDFCCGGNISLADAVKEKDLNSDKVLGDLNTSYTKFKEQNSEFVDWAKETPSRLIDYIVNTHHSFLKEELPRLSEYTFKILQVHGENHDELYKVNKLFNNLRNELEGHLVKEEKVVFPLIKQYEKEKSPDAKNKVLSKINELEQEHTGAGEIIMELREVTNHYKIPSDACRTFEMTYKKLKEVESDLFQHIHLENNILFKNL